MNPRIKSIQDQMSKTHAAMLAILDGADKREGDEKGRLTDEETKTYAAMEAKFDGLKADLERAKRLADAEKSMQPDGTAATVEGIDEPYRAGDVKNNGPRVLQDPKRGFVSVGEFASTVRDLSTPGASRPSEGRLQAAVQGMQQGVGPDGGFLVPPAFSTTIWDGLNSGGDNLLTMTDNYTVIGDSLTFPANAETSRATGSRYGGIQGYWISEGGTITKSNPKFRQMKLEPHELAVLVPVTNKLLSNTTALEQYLSRGATDEINWLVGNAIINGDGVGKPVGVVGHASVVSVAKETGQPAATVVKKNIDKMWARCHARARSRAVWFINQDVETALEDLSADVGTGGVPVYLPAGGIADTPNARLKGRPVIALEFCKTLGTVGDIILADLTSYAVGMRGGIETAMSIHLYFDSAQTAFRFMFAVDGQPWLASALTPANGTNTLSPIVTLATRA